MWHLILNDVSDGNPHPEWQSCATLAFLWTIYVQKPDGDYLLQEMNERQRARFVLLANQF
jgi:hypothetical protein